MKRKVKKKRGPEPERLKLKGNWENVMKRALSAPPAEERDLGNEKTKEKN